MIQPLRSIPITGLLHYYGLVRLCAPHWYSHPREALSLEFLPYHRDDRFPRSTQEPGSGSRHLYAGRHPSSKQVHLGLILEFRKPPVLTSPYSFRHLISGSLALASLILT